MATDAQRSDDGRFLTVLTLNVFSGSPLPFLFNGTRALFGSARLEAQLAAVAGAKPDVVCLQELYCTRARDMYRERFWPEYEVLHETRATAAGVGWARAIECLSALLVVLLARAVLVPVWGWPILRPEDAAIIVGAYVGAFVLWRNSALFAWLAGDATGLTVLIRRDIGAVRRHTTRAFSAQQGDWMNAVAPRGYSKTEIDTKWGSLAVFNAHLNALGTQSERCAQVHELVAAVNSSSNLVVVCADLNATEDSDSARLLTQAAKLRDAMEGVEDRCTWSDRNSLSRAWMKTEDMCVDFVFFRGTAAAGSSALTVRVAAAATVFTEAPFVSDHFGMLATLNISSSSTSVVA